MLIGITQARLYAVLTGLLLTALITLWLQTTHPFAAELRQRLEWMVYDMRMNATLPADQPHHKVIIIDIDEKSLSTYGRWPWPRTTTANLIQKLHEQGIVVSALDIVFPETELNAVDQIRSVAQQNHIPINTLKIELDKLKKLVDGDRYLANVVDRHEVVGGYILNHSHLSKGTAGLPLKTAIPEKLTHLNVATITGLTGNIETLAKAFKGSGFFNIETDIDGVVRRYNLIMVYNDQLYSSLALEALRLYYIADHVGLKTALIADKPVLEAVVLGNYPIPTDGLGRVLIPFRPPGKGFNHFSAADILDNKVPKEQLADRIAFIGSTAKALFDFRTTPVQGSLPGLEIHANVAAAIIDHKFPRSPDWTAGANLLTVIVIGILLSLLLPFAGALSIFVVMSTTIGLIFAINYFAWLNGIQLYLAMPVTLVILLGIGNLVFGFLSESLGKNKISKMFGQYVPPDLVKEMNKLNHHFGFEGEKREMSVLFADIRNFTSLSEHMEPQQLKDLLNKFFTPMTKLIFDYRGTVDKYVGDMIMAFWGAPLKDDKHALNAVLCAMTMLQETVILRQKFSQLGLPEVRIGIGINTGVMNVGDMGSEYRRSYTVLGDAVNIASRLEEITKYYGASLVIGENTKALVEHQILCRRIDKVRLKGKHEPLTIYEPLGEIATLSPTDIDEYQAYEQAMEWYFEKAWNQAHEVFEQLSEQHPDNKLFAFHHHRTAGDPEVLPEQWDGVLSFGTRLDPMRPPLH